jgi:DNA-binding transcriptional regulator WhiA
MKIMTKKFSSLENARRLIDACVKECKRWSVILKKIEIWDPSPFIREIEGVKIEERSESLSSLAVFNDGEFEWVGNEFLHWV